MTVKKFCEENALSEKQYWYYHKRFGDELEESVTKNHTALTTAIMPRFAEVPCFNSPAGVTGSAVIIAGSLKIEVSEQTTEEMLVKILKAVKNA